MANAMDRRSATRASLACLPCRTQHLKCDGAQPDCSRCKTLSKGCSYPESRRTGRYRARARSRTRQVASTIAARVLTPAYTSSSLFTGEGESPASVCPPTSLASVTEADGIMGDASLDLYYEYFHCGHPFILPKVALLAKLTTGPPSLQSLVRIMRHIGSSYGESATHKNIVPEVQDHAVVDGFVVQATLLFALVKSMCAERAASDALLATTISQAKHIGMHTKAFAEAVADSDPALAESWRRTWWMLYVTDLNFAVIRYDFKMLMFDSVHDVDLPCDDSEYASMDISRRTASFDDFKNREYALESPKFSSFAYLIDATRIFVASLRASTQYESIYKAEILCDDLEAAIVGWFVLLPTEKRELAVQPAMLDQLMFQAHMMMYTSLAYIHRPLSGLGYDPAEGLSSCGSPPPPLASTTTTGSAFNHKAHSHKLVQAVRKQNQCLILLPIGTAQLSPFLICMIACCTIAHLVACKSAFTPEEAEVARSRIRVCLGTLKHYEDVWPRAKKILRELRTIAQIIMRGHPTSPPVPAASDLLVEQDMVFANFFDREWLQALEGAS